MSVITEDMTSSCILCLIIKGVHRGIFSGPGHHRTHPIPLKYLKAHEKLSFWDHMNMDELLGGLMKEDRRIMKSYD